jgi:hypothetical protein
LGQRSSFAQLREELSEIGEMTEKMARDELLRMQCFGQATPA